MKLLQVVPNPYGILDADGNPIAVFPCHRGHAPGEFVGATLQMEVLEPAETIQVKRKGRGGTSRLETVQSRPERSRASFTFTTEPVEVPADGSVGAYYRAGVRSGELIAADQATARACGRRLEPVDVVLARERERAAKAYSAEWGNLPPWAQEETKPAPVVAP